MEKVMKFQELNEKYSQLLMDKLTGEENVTVDQLRKLAKEADIGDEINLNSSDEEFLNSLKYYIKYLVSMT